ncbi:cilia- and flagella-associated protein 144 [Odontesthes bonariensis]|uniref:cilia- and flagella-associated protein 144 n=1 Tax=Odontesthes bonariensis TaxID=219752 RepID=UPI003F588511
MAEKIELDYVRQDRFHTEIIRKEQKLQKLHTEFSINPYRTLHIMPDKPMCRKPPEVIADNSGYIEALHRAKLEPIKKYPVPLTESQEIGWLPTPLIQSMSLDKRLNFQRITTDVTKHAEYARRRMN